MEAAGSATLANSVELEFGGWNVRYYSSFALAPID
jgi:hypothetical protein